MPPRLGKLLEEFLAKLVTRRKLEPKPPVWLDLEGRRRGLVQPSANTDTSSIPLRGRGMLCKPMRVAAEKI
jgi:hypothetical protein